MRLAVTRPTSSFPPTVASNILYPKSSLLMLKPAPIREIKGDRPRMWMMDAYMDLIIWYLPDGGLYGFQLCYDKEHEERCLTWRHTGAFTHTRIDSGETNPLNAKGTPMALAGGSYDHREVHQQFQNRSPLIDQALRTFVLLKLTEATLAKLPASEGRSFFLKEHSGEMGPLSKEGLLERFRAFGIPTELSLRFEGESVWRPLSDFFPDQFASTP